MMAATSPAGTSAAPATAAAGSSIDTAPSPTRRLRAVIIDDTPDLRELLGLAMRRRKVFEVVGEAGDGARGIEVVRSTRPDVVVLDLAMPVMDGLEALPALKQLVPDAVILVLSGFGADALTEQALAGGAADYIQKGVPLFDIVERILTLCDERGLGPSIVPTQPESPHGAVSSGDLPPQKAAAPADQGTPAMHPFPDDVDPAVLLAGVGAFVLVLTDEEDPTVRWLNPAADAVWQGRLTIGSRLASLAPDLVRLAQTHREAGGVFDTPVGYPQRPGTAMARRQDGHLVVLARASDTDTDSHRLRRAIATTAHEIRNPVTVLSGVAEAFEDGDLPPALQRRLLESVRRQAGLLESITADLLTAAQADRGTLRVDSRPLDVESTVREILAPHPDVRLVAGRAARMLADPYRFEQMLSNLVSNAKKYGASPIVVKIDVGADTVAIAVEDSGEGVPEAFRDRLFTEYARAEGTQARGTGLGLFVVKQLAEAQQGTVSYHPSVLGGSCFTITLPTA